MNNIHKAINDWAASPILPLCAKTALQSLAPVLKPKHAWQAARLLVGLPARESGPYGQGLKNSIAFW